MRALDHIEPQIFRLLVAQLFLPADHPGLRERAADHNLVPDLGIAERSGTPQIARHAAANRRIAMAYTTELAEISGAIGDLRGRTGQSRWIEWRAVIGPGIGQLGLAAKLEHQQPRMVADRTMRLGHQPARERPCAAPAREHRDILLALDAEGRCRCDHAGLRSKAPQLAPGGGIKRVEFAAHIALEQQIARRREQPAIPRAGIFYRPARLLLDRIPGDQLARGRGNRCRARFGIGGHCAGRQIKPYVEAMFIGFPAGLVNERKGRIDRGNIDQPIFGIIGHRMPVMRADRAGRTEPHFAGAIIARLGIFDRSPGLDVKAAGPIDRDIVFRRDQLAIGAVEHEKETVLGRLHQHLARFAANVEIGEHDMLGRGIIPGFARCRLEMPDIFASLGPQRDDRREVEIIAFALAAIKLVPRRAIADADIEQVKLGIIGHRIPHGATATLLPIFALPRRFGAFEMRRLILAGRIGHRIKAPHFLAGFGIIGGQETAHAHFSAAIADDHHAAHHARRTGDSIGLRLVERDLAPHFLASVAVERDQPPVERAHEQLVAPRREPAIDDIAACRNAALARNLGIIFP